MNEIDRDIEAFEQLKPRLERLWDRIFPGDDEPYTSVVIPSLTLDQEEMAKIPGIGLSRRSAFSTAKRRMSRIVRRRAW